MLKPSDDCLLGIANWYQQHQTSSTNLLYAANGSLKTSMWHPLWLSGINVNDHAVADLVLPKKGSERRPGLSPKNSPSFPPITARLRHFTVNFRLNLRRSALNASVKECPEFKFVWTTRYFLLCPASHFPSEFFRIETEPV